MDDILLSCVAPSPTQCNNATALRACATIKTTNDVSINLLSLAKKALLRLDAIHDISRNTKESHCDKAVAANQIEESCTSNQESCKVALPIVRNNATTKHQKRKKALGDRVQILRVLLQNILNDPEGQMLLNFKGSIINGKIIENYLDNELISFDYDLEGMIDLYRTIYALKPSVTTTTTCNQCEHFMPDKIGDGSGIGECYLNITYTKESKGYMPLFRHAKRHCKQFSKLIS